MADSGYMEGLSALISSGAALANTISVNKTDHADRRFMREMFNKNKEFQREMNEYNYNIWKEGLEYDSPAAQYQRYIDAGLNPAYYMGEAQGSGVTAPQSVDLTQNVDPHERMAQFASIKSQAMTGIGDSIYQLADLSLRKKQVENETRKLYRNEDVVNENIALLRKDGLIKDNEAKELQYKVDQAKQAVSLVEEQVNAQRYQNTPLQYEALKYQHKIDNEYYKLDNYLDYLGKFGKSWQDAGKGSLYYAGMTAANNFLDFADKKMKELGIKIKGFNLKDYKLPDPYKKEKEMMPFVE